jgi:N-acetylglucosamine malate deacetylase 1
MKNILVVAVHPDDETLGCGGTLLKHKHNGDKIHWLIATDMKESEGFAKEDVLRREEEITAVKSAYKFDSIHRLGLSAMRVDEYSMSEIISAISKVIHTVKPEVLFLPFKNDVHSDHRKIFEAAYSCSKSFRYPFIKKIYMMETLSETEFAPATKEEAFVPNVFVNINDFIDAKIEIMKIFQSEMAEHPFPRSERNLRALATLRGATSACEYAESFMLLKEII